MFENIQVLLASGADVALIALLAVMWRFDRRLLELELIIEQLFRKGENS